MVKQGWFTGVLVVASTLLLSACGGSDSGTNTVDSVAVDDGSDGSDDSASTCSNPVTTLPSIFLEFNTSPNVTATLSSDGCFVTLEANGKPTVKLSDNVNKAMGPNEDVKKYMKIFELSEQNQDSLIV